jgi:uncharacterized protein (DUF1778 family)
MPNAALKRERMHLRLDAPTKRKLERAAAYAQKTTTDFVLARALEAAERVIQDHERNVVLSEAAWEAFFDALLNPPKPNPALRTAFRRHRKLTA